MAALYMRPTPWPVGTTVAVYLGSVAAGAPVTTTVVREDNSVLVPGLTVGLPYIAVGSGQSVVFTLGDTVDPGGGGDGVDQTARNAAAAAQATADAAQPAATAATDSELATHAGTTGVGQHIPSGGITNTEVAGGAAIGESKLALASDAAAGTASRRSLGTGATQASAGNHGHTPANLGWTGTPAAGKYPDGGGSWLTMGSTPNGAGEFINIQRAPYNAASNSDITSVLQQVASDVNGGGQPSYTVYMPGSGYTFSASINFTKPVKVVGDGFGSTTLRRTAAAAQLKFTGVRGTAKALTANANANQDVVSCNTSGLVADQYAIVRTDALEVSSTAGANVGEIVRIKTVGGSSVTLYAPLVYSHATASGNAQLIPLTLLTGCSVEGLRVFQNYGALTASGAVFSGLIRFQYCEGPAIDELLMTGYDMFGASFDTCVDALATRVRLRDSYWSNLGWWSYGIESRGPTRNTLISQCYSRNANLLAGGGSADGAPLRVRCADCGGTENVEDQSQAGVYKTIFELHGDCHEWSLDNCYAENGNGLGFEIKGRNAILSSPKAHDMAGGIQCFATQSQGTRIYNPDIKNTNSYGIVLSGGCTVQGGRLENTGNVAGILTGSSSGAFPPGNNTITGTELRSAGGTSATASDGQGAVVLNQTTDVAKNLVVRGSATQIGVNYKSGGTVPSDITMFNGGAATGTH